MMSSYHHTPLLFSPLLHRPEMVKNILILHYISGERTIYTQSFAIQNTEEHMDPHSFGDQGIK